MSSELALLPIVGDKLPAGELALTPIVVDAPIVDAHKTVWFGGRLIATLDRNDDSVSQRLIGLSAVHDFSKEFTVKSLLEFVNSKTHAEIHSSYLLVSATVFLEQTYGISMDGYHQEYRRNARHKPWRDAGLLADVAVWRKAFFALQQLNRLGQWTYPSPIFHPALALIILANEGHLIGYYAQGADDAISAREWLEGYRKATEELNPNRAQREKLDSRQKISAQKNKLRNPFPKNSFTYRFVQSCLDVLAHKNVSKSASSAFLDDFWMPLIASRREYLKVIQGGKPVLIRADTLKPARPQVNTMRKSQKKSNAIPEIASE